MHFDLLIRGGHIVSSSGVTQGDLGIVGESIVAVGSLASSSASEVIDATGLHIFPGIIDTQVHFREPGMEHKEDLESGTRAAMYGGVTTIFEMPNTNPTTTTKAALQDKLDRARGRAWCDYSFFVGASNENIDQLCELEMLPGTPGIKVFMGSSTGPLLVDGENNLRRVMQNGERLMPVHAEDEARNTARKRLLSESPHAREHPFLRDAESARLATSRLLTLCRETGRPVHVLHVSTADELPLLRRAKQEGLPVTCEVTPQHLYFAGPDCYERLGTLAQMNPPVRSEEHRAALRAAFDEGLFDVIGSDHAPHTLEEKVKPYPTSPSGMPGVQTSVQVMLKLTTDLPRLCAMMCERPAEIYGISRKGRIAEGFDADLCLIEVGKTITFERAMVQSKCGWSPYEGERLNEGPRHVVLRGSQVIADGELRGVPRGTAVKFGWKHGTA